VYESALIKTPIVSKSSDAGKIKKILDEGRDVLFWNWLNILRTEVRESSRETEGGTGE
jgi:hypothetical protein